MSGNTFGRFFRLTTYGESHGPALGGVVDGCPAGIALSEELLQKELDRRRPGGGTAGTTRKEPDAVRLLSGVFEGATTGTPIGFQIENTNQRSGDYGPLAAVWRPGHADMTYDAKYGVRDFRGGGRSSARETAARVAGGAIARALLAAQGISVRSCTLEIGGMPAPAFTPEDMAGAASRPYCAPCEAAVEPWEALVRTVRGEGDTLGGIVRVEVLGVPAGLGEPVFDKLDAVLAQALMSVGAVKGVEIGDGFAAARSRGSFNNDAYRPAGAGSTPGNPATNHCGGILGGISTGQPVKVRIAFKPTSSILIPVETVTREGDASDIITKGRHDPCVGIRGVPVVEAMMALVLADQKLLHRAQCGAD